MAVALQVVEEITRGVRAESMFSYQINERDDIVHVNDAWKNFALANNAPELPTRALGASIWQFIAGDDVVSLLKRLFQKVRETRQPTIYPFRCDSPSRRRFLRMKVLPHGEGGLEFISWIEREEDQPTKLLILDPEAARDYRSFVRMCAWCKRIADGSEWLEPHEAIQRLRLFDAAALPRITHGLCPDCFDQLKGKCTADRSVGGKSA